MRALGEARVTGAALRWLAVAVLALGVASLGAWTASASSIVHDGVPGVSSRVGPSFWVAASFSSSAANGWDGFTRSTLTPWTLEEPELTIDHSFELGWRVYSSPGYSLEQSEMAAAGAASSLSRTNAGYQAYGDFDEVAYTLTLTTATLSFDTQRWTALPMPGTEGTVLGVPPDATGGDAPTLTDAGREFAHFESCVGLACSLEGDLFTVGPPVLEPSRLLPFTIGAIVMALVQRRRNSQKPHLGS